MFRLLRVWDAEWELSPEDFQYILTPREAFQQARIFYDLSSDRYHYPDRVSCHDVPRRKSGNVNILSVADDLATLTMFMTIRKETSIRVGSLALIRSGTGTITVTLSLLMKTAT